MVLCQDTGYVLLDEPLSNLDIKHAVAMMRLMRRTADELGETVVLVLHDINVAACYSDHVVAMRDGVVVHQGAPGAIMTAEVMRDVYDIDVAVHRIDGRPIGVYYTQASRARQTPRPRPTGHTAATCGFPPVAGPARFHMLKTGRATAHRPDRRSG